MAEKAKLAKEKKDKKANEKPAEGAPAAETSSGEQSASAELIQKPRVENAEKNTTDNETSEISTEKLGWKIRRDDTFPYQPTKNTFLSGYYSARPHLKQKVRDFTTSFHSSLRLIAQ